MISRYESYILKYFVGRRCVGGPLETDGQILFCNGCNRQTKCNTVLESILKTDFSFHNKTYSCIVNCSVSHVAQSL
jgi:hypothetical protein